MPGLRAGGAGHQAVHFLRKTEGLTVIPDVHPDTGGYGLTPIFLVGGREFETREAAVQAAKSLGTDIVTEHYTVNGKPFDIQIHLGEVR